MALYSIKVQSVFSGVAYPRTWGLFNFSKVPKLFGPISGATIPFISSQRRGSRLSNFAIVLGFLILKTSALFYNKKISFSKQADCSLTTSFSGPKSSGDFRETGPWPPSLEGGALAPSVIEKRSPFPLDPRQETAILVYKIMAKCRSSFAS